MSDTRSIAPATLGWSGFAIGAAALILTLVMFWAGPFAPQQSAGVSIGELAAEIAKSAARSVAGQPPPDPAILPRTMDDHLEIVAGVLAGLAVVLGVAALIRHEHRRASVSGIALGMLAMGIQLFTYSILLIAGALVVSAVIYSLRDAFGDIFDGLFGG